LAHTPDWDFNLNDSAMEGEGKNTEAKNKTSSFYNFRLDAKALDDDDMAAASKQRARYCFQCNFLK